MSTVPGAADSTVALALGRAPMSSNGPTQPPVRRVPAREAGLDGGMTGTIHQGGGAPPSASIAVARASVQQSCHRRTTMLLQSSAGHMPMAAALTGQDHYHWPSPRGRMGVACPPVAAACSQQRERGGADVCCNQTTRQIPSLPSPYVSPEERMSSPLSPGGHR